MSEENTFGEIIVDSTKEDFEKYCEDKDLGYLKNLNALITKTYYEVVTMKDALVKKITDDKIPEGSKEHKSVSDLFSVLFRLEGKSVMLQNMIKDREKSSKDSLS